MGLDHYPDHVSYYSPARKDDYAFRVKFPDDMPEPEAEANARLIRAAAQMFEALAYIAGHASMARHHANERGWLASLENVEKAAREAIALINTDTE
jgi:hypothetical protein